MFPRFLCNAAVFAYFAWCQADAVAAVGGLNLGKWLRCLQWSLFNRWLSDHTTAGMLVRVSFTAGSCVSCVFGCHVYRMKKTRIDFVLKNCLFFVVKCLKFRINYCSRIVPNDGSHKASLNLHKLSIRPILPYTESMRVMNFSKYLQICAWFDFCNAL